MKLLLKDTEEELDSVQCWIVFLLLLLALRMLLNCGEETGMDSREELCRWIRRGCCTVSKDSADVGSVLTSF